MDIRPAAPCSRASAGTPGEAPPCSARAPRLSCAPDSQPREDPTDRNFVSDYKGAAFELFGPAHLVALACVAVLCLSFVALRRFGSDPLKRGVRIALGLILLVNEIGWHWWALTFDTWNPRTMLPLHICSVFTWLGVVMLLWKSYPVFELAYFLGIGGALQALLTPDAGIYGFPHFRAFQTFISHGLVFAGPIFMAVVEGYRPTVRSLGRVLLWGNLYMIPVYFVNRIVGSNYMYLNAKPPTASILDACGPWPWYILAMEAFGLVTLSLLYIPYALADLAAWRRRSQPA